MVSSEIATNSAHMATDSPVSPVHYFGIRHHGPGCARSLQRALQSLQPDCILVEGPPEGDALLPFVLHADMRPPVALLVHSPQDTEAAVFYPFAEFSPEWQALRFGVQTGVPTRFMDLPQAMRLAQKTSDDVADVNVGTPQPRPHDPLDALAHAAGHADGESWWNHLVEERGDGENLFVAIAEAMHALRQEWPADARGAAEQLLEEQREAHMCQMVREAVKAGYQRIAVVCGAWHVPALQEPHTAKADAACLKGLPKIKVDATWVPWTYQHLTRTSGYGAGVQAPGWYDYLWRSHSPETRASGWLTRVARLLRAHDLDCSSAHVIEAARLADTLAAMRGRGVPGLEELNEAVQSAICMGETTPMRLIHDALTVADILGQVPSEVPAVPLQRDIEHAQKTLRLKPEALQRTLELDLRQENDRARSHLLHRLRLLDLPWGEPARNNRANRGTFRETWQLQWQPEFAVRIIEASRFGATVEQAACACVAGQCSSADSLEALANLVEPVLWAELAAAVPLVSAALQARAASTGDALQLISAIPALAQVFRYGSVRQTDGALLAQVLDGLITRGAIGLPLACQGLDESAAEGVRTPILAAHEAIALRDDAEQTAIWQGALQQIALGGAAHALLRGLCCRLLLDASQLERDQAAIQLSRQLSAGAPPLDAAQWLDGFLNRNALVLLHDVAVWQLVDHWLAGLSEEHFLQVVALVRRSFANFSSSERRSLGERAARGAPQTQLGAAPALDWDAERAALPVPVLRMLLLGLPVPAR